MGSSGRRPFLMMSFVAMVTQPLLHLIYRLSESFATGSESRKIVLVLFHELLLLIEEVERLEKSFARIIE